MISYLKLKISTKRRLNNQIFQADWSLFDLYKHFSSFFSRWIAKKVWDKNLHIVLSDRIHSKLTHIEKEKKSHSAGTIVPKWCWKETKGDDAFRVHLAGSGWKKTVTLKITLNEVINSCSLRLWRIERVEVDYFELISWELWKGRTKRM